MTANSEHARYEFVEATKATAIAEVSKGMSREEVEAIITRHTGSLGKQARKSLRSACYSAAGLDHPADYQVNKGHLTKSKRGTWANVIGSRAYALTRKECVERNLVPGPGND